VSWWVDSRAVRGRKSSAVSEQRPISSLLLPYLGAPRSSAPLDELNRLLDGTARLDPTQEFVEAANSMALAAGALSERSTFDTFVVDAMLTLVYPARSCWNQRRVATTRVALFVGYPKWPVR
jgi:hypothetical protein